VADISFMEVLEEAHNLLEKGVNFSVDLILLMTSLIFLPLL